MRGIDGDEHSSYEILLMRCIHTFSRTSITYLEFSSIKSFYDIIDLVWPHSYWCTVAHAIEFPAHHLLLNKLSCPRCWSEGTPPLCDVCGMCGVVFV